MQQVREIDVAQYRIPQEPFYAEVCGEIGLFTIAAERKLPVMLKGPTGCGKTSLTRSRSADEVDLSTLFAMPHFGIHPRLFFGSAFLKEGIEPDGIMLTTEAGIPSEQGTLVCATCHDASKIGPDASSAVNPEQAIMNEGFLRTGLGLAEKFCSVCHGGEAPVRFLYFHKKW